MRRSKVIVWSLFVTLLALIAIQFALSTKPGKISFDAARAYQDIQYQVSLGARVPGSHSHIQTTRWITEELKKHDWQVEIQESWQLNHIVKNVIAKRGAGSDWFILGAHYDSRQFADRDPNPEKWREPVPGANDSASGVAVLMEIGRQLPKDLPLEIWLVFFDAEDQGNIPGWDWILGSKSFVKTLNQPPNGVVIIDMIGDRDLNIYMEKNSDLALTTEIWDQAKRLGYSQYFIPEHRYSILDDHIPFIENGIPAVDIIDFDYPFWHTTSDTLDKVSEESLKIVGETMIGWIQSKTSK